jgi:GMP synthase (glutamine-hydrolysing)
VLQHIPDGPPDAYALELARRGAAVVRVRPDLGEPLPDWRDFGGILAMGGPMSAFDDDRHPWLVPEKRMIAEAVRAGTPFWGVCLGAQLLAASLGSGVWRAPEPELGMRTICATEAAAGDAVFRVAPRRLETLQWHRDTFALPDGARLLATSRPYPHQAFAWRNAYGVQFHLEPSREVVEHWARRSRDSPAPPVPLAPEALRALLADMERHAGAATRLARRLMGRWVGLAERLAAASPRPQSDSGGAPADAGSTPLPPSAR